MIKLNTFVRGICRYEPPVPVVPHFEDIDVSAPIDEQIENLLWIPATLVCRFLFQFPYLSNEADELFSIGMERVVRMVNEANYPGDKLGGAVNLACRKAMEDYANNLTTVVNVGTTTRYKNYRKGKATPSSQALSNIRVPAVNNDVSQVEIEDAAKVLGIDLENMTLSDKRKLAAHIL